MAHFLTAVDTGQMGALGNQNSPLVATSLLNPVLTAGTNYWIVASPATPGSDTWAAWNINDQGAMGTELYSQDGGMTFKSRGSIQIGAFQILSVPEPGTISLLALGVAGIVGYGKLRRPTGRGEC